MEYAAFCRGPTPSAGLPIEALLQLGQPIVVFQETLRFPGRDICVIRLDDRAGGRMLAQHVISAGAKRLVMLISRSHWPGIAERVAGVRQIVRGDDSGVTLRLIKSQSMQFDNVKSRLAEDIAQNGIPDAVMAGNDHMGVAALKLLTERGNQAFPRMSLSPASTLSRFWQYTDPTLTSIRSL